MSTEHGGIDVDRQLRAFAVALETHTGEPIRPGPRPVDDGGRERGMHSSSQAMADRVQSHVDPTTQSQDTPAPHRFTEPTRDTNEPTLEVIMLNPDRNEPATTTHRWMMVAAAVATLVVVVGLLVVATRADEAPAPADQPELTVPPEPVARVETFTFSSGGVPTGAKIYLPASYDRDANLPALFLFDHNEPEGAGGTVTAATDEFERVIAAVADVQGLDAVVVTLEEQLDVEGPQRFDEYYTLFEDLALHVDGEYTDNPSRTFIGRGGAGGIVLQALLASGPGGSVFEKFVVTDPAPEFLGPLAFDGVVDQLPVASDRQHRLHLSFSTSSTKVVLESLIEVIEEAQLSWLEFESVFYSESTYAEAYPNAFADGIRFVFGG